MDSRDDGYVGRNVLEMQLAGKKKTAKNSEESFVSGEGGGHAGGRSEGI